MRRATSVDVADLLTMSRFAVALALVPATWLLDLELTAILVSAAWVTDVSDGRLARRGGGEGRLGRWDMTADTAVGAGLLVGLTGAGVVPIAVSVAALIVLGGWFLAGNVSAAMLLQLCGYLPLLWLLWADRPALWWLPPIVAIAIGIVDWRRLFTVNIPAFLRGITGRNASPEPDRLA